MKWIIALVSLLALAVAADGADAKERFKARLTGDQEVPTPVVTDATGRFDILFNDDLTEARFALTVRGLQGVQRAHLHCNVAGSNGPIFIHLIGDLHATTASQPTPSSIDVDGKWLDHARLTNGSFTLLTSDCGDTLAELVDAIKAGMVYVNVHTVANPAGAIRGQLQ
jgi:hypothetical protein